MRQSNRRMAKTSEISTDLRGKFYKEGISIRNIAKRLDMPRGTVFSIVKKFRETVEVKNVPGRGRKKKTTPRTDRLIRPVSSGQKGH